MISYRLFRNVSGVFVAVLIVLATASPLSAQGAPTGVTAVELHVRAGPGQDYASLTVLPPGATVVLDGPRRVGGLGPGSHAGWRRARLGVSGLRGPAAGL